MPTIEERVAEAILEEKTTVEIGGETYEVAPPTTATLILVSKLVSKIPEIRQVEDEERLIEVLRTAEYCSVVGEIAATLILGAKALRDGKKNEKKCFLNVIFPKWKKPTDKKAELADFILHNMSPRELSALVGSLLWKLQVKDFFHFTASLSEINLMKPTGEAVTTVSGQ